MNNILTPIFVARNYTHLEIYNLGYAFAKQIYSILKLYPAHETGNIVQQLKRSAISIISNIAEGSTRPSKKEFLYFINCSYGSAKEIQVLLDISKDLSYINHPTHEKVSKALDELGAKLFCFMRNLEKDTPYRFYQQFNNELAKTLK